MPADPRTTSSASSTTIDGIVCPFCAHVRPEGTSGACPRCTMEDTVGTRRSTGERIGPWFVLQRKNPTAPGLRFSVLLTLARRGHVTGKSIVRGPTTGQLWRYASEVKGLSRLFGTCWHCHGSVSPDAITCPRCKSAQEIPDDPDVFLENHSALPLMRELPAVGEELTGFSDSPIDDRAARGPRRDLPARRADRQPAAPAREPAREASREQSAFDNIDDLSRALTLHQPPDADGNRSMRRTNGRATSEPILSASELANAFQLSATRPSLTRRTGRLLWKLTKVAAALMLLLMAAAIAVGALKPEWRAVAQERAKPYVAQASVWWTDLSARVVGTAVNDPSKSVAPLDADGKPMAVPPPTPIQADRGTAKADAPKPNSPKPAAPAAVTRPQVPSVVDATPPAAPATQPRNAPRQPSREPARDTGLAARTPTAAPSPVAPTPVPPTPAPPTPTTTEVAKAAPNAQLPRQDPPKQDPPKVETVKAEAPKPEAPKPEAKPAPSELTIDEAIAQGIELRNSALDAEARRDWRAAVVIYEQIGRLPEEARPSDLKVRLALAKERLQGQ